AVGPHDQSDPPRAAAVRHLQHGAIRLARPEPDAGRPCVIHETHAPSANLAGSGRGERPRQYPRTRDQDEAEDSRHDPAQPPESVDRQPEVAELALEPGWLSHGLADLLEAGPRLGQ